MSDDAVATSSSSDAEPGSGPGKTRTTISVSAGFADLLRRLGISLAFTSYQSGQLFLVGVEPSGRVAIDQQHFERAMGLHWADGRLLLATATQIVRFENMLMQGERADGRNDVVMVPRLSWTTNDVDAHEVATAADGCPLFVATRFNCIATVDERFSFSPVWMPNFLTGSTKGDKCHLNGLAMRDGTLGFASAVATTDIEDGWRRHRKDGGVIIDCQSGRTIVTGLSMPHSPRWHGDALWFLESGTGQLVRFDPATQERRNIAFCPGFARGLALGSRHALVTVSKPRDKRFEGLQLDQELAARSQKAWCGVLLIDLARSIISGWIRLDGPIQELFDVVALPGVACPRALGPATKELGDNVRPRA